MKKALEGLDGVSKAKISFKEKRGEVSFDSTKVNEKVIVEKVNQVGFRATVMEK